MESILQFSGLNRTPAGIRGCIGCRGQPVVVEVVAVAVAAAVVVVVVVEGVEG